MGEWCGTEAILYTQRDIYYFKECRWSFLNIRVTLGSKESGVFNGGTVL